MTYGPCLGLTPHPPNHIAHLAILLQPPRDPSPFASLPTEILTHIAQIAQDAYLADKSSAAHNRTCPCCGKAATGKHAGVAKEVVALGGTSRRIRAVLVNAGFFRAISRHVRAEDLFATSVVATEGFLENADIVALHLDHEGPEGASLDTASLRCALDLYTGAEHMYIEWHAFPPTPPHEPLPPLPPTRIGTFVPPEPSRLRTLLLAMLDPAAHDDASPPSGTPVQSDCKPQELMKEHLEQFLPVVAHPGLEELDVTMHFSDHDVTVLNGVSVFADAVQELQWEELKRLGYMGYHDVDSRKQLSESWLTALEGLLTLAPRISPKLEDLDIGFNVRINRSSVFDGPMNDPASATLSGLIPLQNQVCELLQRLADAEVKITPFTVAVTAAGAVLPVSPTLLLLDYVPREYNTEEGRSRLPNRMQGVDAPSSLTSEVIGGDELRFAVNSEGLEDIFIDVVGVETMRDTAMPERMPNRGPMVVDVDVDALPPMPSPMRTMFQDMFESIREEFDA